MDFSISALAPSIYWMLINKHIYLLSNLPSCLFYVSFVISMRVALVAILNYLKKIHTGDMI